MTKPKGDTMKIEPKYVDGEPVCSGVQCDSYLKEGFATNADTRCYVEFESVSTGQPCIPQLRADRDQAIKERDELERACSGYQQFLSEIQLREKALQREICKIGSRLEPCTKEEIAKSRGWHDIFEGGE